MIDIEKCKYEFKKYVGNYDMDNDMISRKYYHSLRVALLCKNIAISLHLSADDVLLAETIGILHDIGRFEQAKLYNTYNDHISVDHAMLGQNILLDNNYLNNYVENSEIKEIILIAIFNHNKLKIENNLTERQLLFCKIIRDADKIDIYRLIIEEDYYHVNDGGPNSKVIDDILNYRSVNKANAKTMIDELICTFGFIFDINYVESIIIINENNYIEKLYSKTLNYYSEYKNILAAIKENINKYINARLEEIKC